MRFLRLVEWPTLFCFVIVYALWAFCLFYLGNGAPFVTLPILAFCIAFHGSLQHEALHGHPTPWTWANALLAGAPLILVVPFLRFKDTHLDHHQDNLLTDPYDDPESNFLDPADWNRMPPALRLVFEANNTLAGRLILGPIIGTWAFLRADWKRRKSDPRIRAGWLWHIPGTLIVLSLIQFSTLSFWAYALAVYGALALLRLRTFLEHQPHELARARSAIVEDKGLFAFLFLNNNLHAVHHAHPNVAWYALPALYRRHKSRFLAMNEHYWFPNYRAILRQYLFRRKDPVPHPLRQSQN